eukprot:PRCOL_00006025-RA
MSGLRERDTNAATAVAAAKRPSLEEMAPRAGGQAGAVAHAAAKAHAAGGVEQLRMQWGAGAFRHVHLENFMCHEHFEADFCPHVNFITGENGSGKSAILTAISTVLGARARSTRRASSLKGMVKTGKGYALITLTIHNGTGSDAFQPDLYGDTITVCRRITESGSNTLSLRAGDRNGKKISGDRKDLDAMLDWFNIDINNPLVVMSQDSSRELMSNGKPEDMYRFYMDATMLGDLYANLRAINQHKGAMKELLKDAENDVRKEQYDREAIEKTLEEYQEIAKYDETIANLRKQLMWAHVAAMHREADQHRDEAGTQQHVVESKQKALQKAQEALQKAEEAEKSAGQGVDSVQEIDAGMAELGKLIPAGQDALRAAKKKLSDAKREHDAAVRAAGQLRNAIKGLEDDIAASEATAAAEDGASNAQRDAAVRSAREATQAAKAALETAKQAEALREQEEKQAKEALNASQRDASTIGAAIRDHQANLKRYSGNKSPHTVFNPEASKVLELITRHSGQFTTPPIGPIGSLITLKDARWSKGVTAALDMKLGSFICNTTGDAFNLRKLCMQARNINMHMLSLTVARFVLPPHRVTPDRQPDSQLVTVYRQLQCERPVVANVLIDSDNIEQLVLEPEDGQRAKEVAFGAMRRNVKAVICANNGTRMEMKGRSQVTRPFFKQLTAKLGANVQEMAAQAQQAIERDQARLQEANGKLAACKDAYGTAQQALREATKRRRQAATDDSKATAVLEGALSEAAEHDQQSQQASTDALKAELESERINLAEKEAAIATRKVAMDAAHAEVEESKTDIDGLKEQLDQLKERHEGAFDAMQKAKDRVVRARKKVIESEGAVRDAERELREAGQRAEEKEKEARGAEAKVTERCPREDLEEAGGMPKKSAQALSNDIKQIENRKRRAEAQLGEGSYDDVERRLKKQRKRERRTREAFEAAVQPYKKLRVALSDRTTRFKTAKDDVRKQVSHRFQETMMERGHQGEVDVDYENEALSLRIRLNLETNRSAGVEGKAVQNVRSLSGGEKSFSTLAFALGLGQLCDAPIRAMDEFDIFMDKVNRLVSTKELMRFAFQEQFRAKQFLLLTPNDMSMIESIKAGLGCIPDDGDMRMLRVKPARNR